MPRSRIDESLTDAKPLQRDAVDAANEVASEAASLRRRGRPPKDGVAARRKREKAICKSPIAESDARGRITKRVPGMRAQSGLPRSLPADEVDARKARREARRSMHSVLRERTDDVAALLTETLAPPAQIVDAEGRVTSVPESNERRALRAKLAMWVGNHILGSGAMMSAPLDDLGDLSTRAGIRAAMANVLGMVGSQQLTLQEGDYIRKFLESLRELDLEIAVRNLEPQVAEITAPKPDDANGSVLDFIKRLGAAQSRESVPNLADRHERAEADVPPLNGHGKANGNGRRHDDVAELSADVREALGMGDGDD